MNTKCPHCGSFHTQPGTDDHTICLVCDQSWRGDDSDLPFRVYSYMRSGTHYLMALLHQNFIMPDCQIDTPERQQIAGFVINNKERDTIPWGRLFGSHKPFDYAVRFWPVNRMIYIHRQPVDCIFSLWKLKYSDQMKFESFFNQSRLVAWKQHVDGYALGDAYIVAYENLKKNPVIVMQSIEQHFGMRRKRDVFTDVTKPVGWGPGEGKSGYINDFDDNTQDHVRKVCKSVFGPEYEKIIHA